ncbi:MAG: HNH endonuclease signature motif containing protein [Dehalococcoidales bacterium]|jgi:5-methylcytosine-specific restriction endonuclease McrA|nr:HNH endonuclease signature motif containing protein [Dehalococcoidales bacterium]MDX9986331.1 HNH endonuclease signature motif containing protein [Dehalococcoidales bacterium]
MRLRFSKADKKNIAKYQNQENIEEDIWLGTTRVVGYRCKKCRREFPLDILEVDHITPVSKGGKDNPANLQLLCPPCNKKKGATFKPKISTLKSAPLKSKITQNKTGQSKSKSTSSKPKTTSVKTKPSNKRSVKPK